MINPEWPVVRITTERRRLGRNYFTDLLVNGIKVFGAPSNVCDLNPDTPEVKLVTKALDAAGVLWTFNGKP